MVKRKGDRVSMLLAAASFGAGHSCEGCESLPNHVAHTAWEKVKCALPQCSEEPGPRQICSHQSGGALAVVLYEIYVLYESGVLDGVARHEIRGAHFQGVSLPQRLSATMIYVSDDVARERGSRVGIVPWCCLTFVWLDVRRREVVMKVFLRLASCWEVKMWMQTLSDIFRFCHTRSATDILFLL